MKIPALIKNSKGFTLIELLVVIGILGILAAALLQTIDPFEQLRKGRDTVRRNTAIELINANTRYYASHGQFPWEETTCLPAAPDGTSLEVFIDCLVTLIDDGELKEGFNTAVANTGDDEVIFVTNDDTSNTVVVCYSPESKSELRNRLTTNNSSGEPDGQCTDPDDRTTGTCFQCFR